MSITPPPPPLAIRPFDVAESFELNKDDHVALSALEAARRTSQPASVPTDSLQAEDDLLTHPTREESTPLKKEEEEIKEEDPTPTPAAPMTTAELEYHNYYSANAVVAPPQEGRQLVVSVQAEERPVGSGGFWSHNTSGITAAGAMNSDRFKNEIAELEAEIIASRKAEEEYDLAFHRQKDIKRSITTEEANENLFKFVVQDTFRWSVPMGSEHYAQIPSVLEDGCRVRTEVPPVLPRLLPLMPSPSLPLGEQEQQLGERHAALIVQHGEMAGRRKATEFDMEEALFLDAASSDDSEGFDEDFEDEWRDYTSYIHSICKAFEIDFSNDAAATGFRSLLKELSTKTHEEVNFAERALVWDTLRLCHRAAQPLHSKQWLTSCHEVITHGGFQHRPSVTDYSCILHAALHLTVLTSRQYNKIERWANRSTYLVRKRVLVLQEFGIPEPTWAQVNASVAGLSRADAKVPTLTLHDTLVALTSGSVQQEVTGPKSPLQLASSSPSSHRQVTGGDGTPDNSNGSAWEGSNRKAPPTVDEPESIHHAAGGY